MDGAYARWDVLIRKALVFDGTGAPARTSDVAVSSGRVIAIGPDLPVSNADIVVHADGQWLMPGLLDVHTHFDLEVEVEPGLPEAVRHGSTTVVVANCSLGLAYGNQRRDGADPIVDCFARVENVPKHVLRKVADRATWNDSRAYLEHFSDLALGPNIAPMIPHSMLRIEVMGLQASVTRAPTLAELDRMGQLLEKGMREGYIGFSTDALPFHYLANRPNTDKTIPTQFAGYEELKALTSVVRRWDRLWQATPAKDDPKAVLKNFLLTSGRLHGKPLKLTAVAALDAWMTRSILPAALLLTRVLNSRWYRGRFRLQALAAAFKVWADGTVTPLTEEVPVLRRLNELDLEDRPGRLALMNDPDWIAEFRGMWHRGKHGFNLARLLYALRLDKNVLSRDLAEMHIDTCPVPDWNGETLQAVFNRLLSWQKTQQGARSATEAEAFASFPSDPDDADFVLHVLRRYDTDLRWWEVTANRNPKRTKRLLFNPLLLPGFNDSGAHLTNMAFYDGNLRMLKLAQEDGPRRVAQAVHRLTLEPADFFGLDAGRLEVGARADLALIDPARLAQWNPDSTYRYIWRDCFAHHQMVNRPEGVVSGVMIAGRFAWREGAYLPEFGQRKFGEVLRHRDHKEDSAVTA